jgi:hypothetical protein
MMLMLVPCTKCHLLRRRARAGCPALMTEERQAAILTETNQDRVTDREGGNRQTQQQQQPS